METSKKEIKQVSKIRKSAFKNVINNCQATLSGGQNYHCRDVKCCAKVTENTPDIQKITPYFFLSVF